jgi:hypothetical protein
MHYVAALLAIVMFRKLSGNNSGPFSFLKSVALYDVCGDLSPMAFLLTSTKKARESDDHPISVSTGSSGSSTSPMLLPSDSTPQLPIAEQLDPFGVIR